MRWPQGPPHLALNLLFFWFFVCEKIKKTFPPQKKRTYLLISEFLPLFLHIIFTLPFILSLLILFLSSFLFSLFFLLCFVVFVLALLHCFLLQRNKLKLLHVKGFFHESFLFSWFRVLICLPNRFLLSSLFGFLS